MDYKATGKAVFKQVGGNNNVVSVTHCATRLRFRLKEKSRVDFDEIKKIPGVLSCLEGNGEIQVVIGPNVTVAYQAIEEEFSGAKSEANQPKDKQKLSERFLGMISGIFAPILPAITAGGMVKAVLAILKVTGAIEVDGQIYQILTFASDAVFYFLPIMLASSAAKVFNMSSGLAMLLAGMLLHPDFVSMVNEGVPIAFFGIPVRAVKYSSTVIPIILIVFIASYVERYANKILPDVIKYIVRPLCVMIVMIPLSLCVLGPIGYIAGDGLAVLLAGINSIAPWLLPTVVGTFTPILVMFGLHNGLIPLASTQFASIGYENIMGPGMLPSNIAQGAASLAVAFKTKDKQLRQTSISTGFTALMGITEPAMYGVTLKYKGLLPAVMAGGFAGGLFAGISGLVRYSFGSPGLATLPVFIGDSSANIIKAVISLLIGFCVTFVITLFIKIDDMTANEKSKPENEIEASKKNYDEIVISSPIKGEVIDITEVKDATFSEKIMGDGIAIIPKEGVVRAPAAGQVMIYDTLHAVGIECENGTEILIHVGMDTVKLNGKHFHKETENGASVKKGDALISFDIDAIQNEGYEITTPVIITNLGDSNFIASKATGDVDSGDFIFKIVNRK